MTALTIAYDVNHSINVQQYITLKLMPIIGKQFHLTPNIQTDAL